MNSKIKKILALGVMVIMALGLFAGCGPEDYVYKEGDFSLETLVDKTEVSVGVAVKVTATLKNLSGRDIRIQLNHTDDKKPEDIISVALFAEDAAHDFVRTGKGGPRKKLTLKKDISVTISMDFIIEEQANCEAVALAIFHSEKAYQKSIAIYSETIKILTKEIN